MKVEQFGRFILAVVGVLGVSVLLYLLWTPSSEVNSLWLASGASQVYGDGTPVWVNGLQLPPVLLKVMDMVLVLAVDVALVLVAGFRSMRPKLKRLFVMFNVVHLAALVLFAVLHPFAYFLLLPVLLHIAQIGIAAALRRVVFTSAPSHKSWRVLVILLDVLLAWWTYTFLVVLLAFATSAHGIPLHLHTSEVTGGFGLPSPTAVPVIPPTQTEQLARALQADPQLVVLTTEQGMFMRQATTVAVVVYLFSVVLWWALLNGSAANVTGLVVVAALLGYAHAHDIIFFALIVLLVMLALTVAFNTAACYLVSLDGEAWADAYTNGVFRANQGTLPPPKPLVEPERVMKPAQLPPTRPPTPQPATITQAPPVYPPPPDISALISGRKGVFDESPLDVHIPATYNKKQL